MERSTSGGLLLEISADGGFFFESFPTESFFCWGSSVINGGSPTAERLVIDRGFVVGERFFVHGFVGERFSGGDGDSG